MKEQVVNEFSLKTSTNNEDLDGCIHVRVVLKLVDARHGCMHA